MAYHNEYTLEELFTGRDASVDIVFVHGLNGEGRRTWTKNGTLWPATLLPKDVPNSRILSFTYDANVTRFDASQVTQGRAENHAAELCAKLAALRAESQTMDRPIIFVSHSFGGLVCAEIIILGDRAVDGDSMHAIANATCGMLFLGTPFCGSSSAGWADKIRSIVNIVHDTNKFSLGDLKKQSETLRTLGEAFPAVLRKRNQSSNTDKRIEIVFFYEALKTSGIYVVDETSAWIPGFGEKIPIRADHHNICKFEDQSNEGYKLVMAAIKHAIAEKAKKKKNAAPLNAGGMIFNNNNTKIMSQGGSQTFNGSQSFSF